MSRTTVFARKTAIVLLFFLGLTALLGAAPLFMAPLTIPYFGVSLLLLGAGIALIRSPQE
jgi:hypothetical protein